jgi:hypothetical protein
MEPEQVPAEMTYRQSVPILARLWQDDVRNAYGDVLKLAPKEFGQLKVLAQQLEDLTPDILSWAVRNWEMFSLDARSNCGLPSVPRKPHIGFLLAHWRDALSLLVSKANRSSQTEAIAFLNKFEQLCERQRNSGVYPARYSKTRHGTR